MSGHCCCGEVAIVERFIIRVNVWTLHQDENKWPLYIREVGISEGLTECML